VEELAEEEIPNDYKVQIALEMAKSQNFDHFVANKFATVKRYGGEGCESLMAFFIELFNSCGGLLCCS
jgi:probable 2-oxoglutarate dehydrogenase E1 component DHKTD1